MRILCFVHLKNEIGFHTLKQEKEDRNSTNDAVGRNRPDIAFTFM